MAYKNNTLKQGPDFDIIRTHLHDQGRIDKPLIIKMINDVTRILSKLGF